MAWICFFFQFFFLLLPLYYSLWCLTSPSYHILGNKLKWFYYRIYIVSSCQGAGDKVTALRQVLNSSERKITSLTKSLHASCEMKGEPNHANTILLVNDHLKKKACCRFILLDLQVSSFAVLIVISYNNNVFCCWDTCSMWFGQLWDVDNLESSHGHHNIVLNYLGFIIQRLLVPSNDSLFIFFLWLTLQDAIFFNITKIYSYQM